MTVKQIVVFPRGQLGEKDRRALQRAGVCVVEADDPSKVVTVLPGTPLISGDDILRAAITALCSDDGSTGMRSRFVKAIGQMMQERAAQQK
jgi:hypothetical protein